MPEVICPAGHVCEKDGHCARDGWKKPAEVVEAPAKKEIAGRQSSKPKAKPAKKVAKRKKK